MQTAVANITAIVAKARPEVISAIRQASNATGVDFQYLLQNAATESSLNPTAKNPQSSARGLFQFIDSTWLDTLARHGAEHGLDKVAAVIKRDADGNPLVNNSALRRQILALRDNPKVAALMAAEFTKDNREELQTKLGREVNHAELYMAHFLGATGAGRFIDKLDAAPTTQADNLLPKAAHANQAVFYQDNTALSVNQVYEKFADKFGEATSTGNSSPAPTAAELAARAATIAVLDGSSINESRVHAETTLALAPLACSEDNSLQLPLFTLNILQQLQLPGLQSNNNANEWET